MRFFHNARGNVGVLFGLAILPLMVAIGMAVDYSRLAHTRTELQAALDTAVLEAATATPHASAEQLENAARSYILNHFADGSFVFDDLELQRHHETLVARGRGFLRTMVIQVAGIGALHIEVESRVAWKSSE